MLRNQNVRMADMLSRARIVVHRRHASLTTGNCVKIIDVQTQNLLLPLITFLFT